MDFSLRTGFHLAPCRSLASAGLDELAQTLWDSRTDNSLEIPARAGLFTRILKQTYGTALRSSAAIYRPFSSTSILDVMPIVAIWMSSKPPTNRFWPSGMLLSYSYSYSPTLPPLRLSRLHRSLFLLPPFIEHGEQQEREEGRGDDAADDHGGQRALDLGAGAGGDGHGHEAEAGHEGGHELGAQPGEGALDHGLADRAAFAAQLVDVADQHDAVQHGDAGEGDEADSGADGEGEASGPECEHAAGDGERHADEDQDGLARAAEAEEDEDEDKPERGGHDQGEPGAGVLEVLELAAELVEIAGGQLH